MKNGSFVYRLQTCKVCCIVTIILISFLITACAGNKTSKHTSISPEEIKQHHNNQQKWLSGLQENMSLEDALKDVFSYQQYLFQYKEKGKLFQYFQGQYPITGMLFGLFFENGRLTSLLLEQAVTDFTVCRLNLGDQEDAWPQNGFQATASWIRQQSRLGDEYGDIATAYKQNTNNSGVVSAGDIVEIAAYIPFFAVAPGVLVVMPFLPDKSEKLRERASQIKLGVTSDIELMRLLGAPDVRTGKDIMVYISLKIDYGIIDGTVSWSEWRVRDLYPLNSVTAIRNIKCEPSN
jgi:hypothetical protein